MTNLDRELAIFLGEFRKDPSNLIIQPLLSSQPFDILLRDILQHDKNCDGELTITYLRDVSSMLALISAVRDMNIERHLQAERKLIIHSFAFDHQNYARYGAYQHIYLQSLKLQNHPAFVDMQINGFGGSISGDDFSSIHGDLQTELFNKETEGNSGPFRVGFSTNYGTVNTWVNTIHIHSKIRMALQKHLHIKTSSKHK